MLDLLRKMAGGDMYQSIDVGFERRLYKVIVVSIGGFSLFCAIYCTVEFITHISAVLLSSLVTS